MKKKPRRSGPKAATAPGGITVSYNDLLLAISTTDGEMAPFRLLRRQRMPMAFSLDLMEIAKAIDEKVAIFNEMRGELLERHFGEDGKKTSAATRAAFDKDFAELLTQQVSLPGRKFPLAIVRQAPTPPKEEDRMCTDALELVLWLFE
jgi:hypothetical protein